MTEANLERGEPRWPRRACALALLAALGCGDAGVEPGADVRPSPLSTHTPRQADIAWARPLMPPTAEGIEQAGLMSLPPSAFGDEKSRQRVAAPTLPELTPLPEVEVEIEAPAPSPTPIASERADSAAAPAPETAPPDQRPA